MASSSKWFYTQNGKDKPRVTISELIQLLNTGKIDNKTYVWHKKYCKEWTPIHQVGYIQNNFISNPSNGHPSNGHSSNNTSEIQEIVANDFGPLSESDEVNMNIAPHIIDEEPLLSSLHNKTYSKLQQPQQQQYKWRNTEYTQSISNTHSKNDSYYSNNFDDDEYFESYKPNKPKKRRKSAESKYGINQLVEINDPNKLGICYGLIIDIRNKKMVIKYNNKQFGKEWFDLNDKRISIVTDSRKKQQHGIQSDDELKTDKLTTSTNTTSSRVILPSTNIYHKKTNKNLETSPISNKSDKSNKSKSSSSRSTKKSKLKSKSKSKLKLKSKSRAKSKSKLKCKPHSRMNGDDNDLILIHRKSTKSTIISTVNINEEKLSLLSERKLLNIARDELEREQEQFYYAQKQHETEVWTVKNDYIEQTKKLKKQYNVYKQVCDELISQNQITDEYQIKYHKLETREKLLKDEEKSVDKKQKTAQILYRRSTQLLQKVHDATLKMEVYSKICDEKCDIERELIEKQEIDRNKYLSKMNKLRDEMLQAPLLLLSSSNTTNNDALSKQLLTTYQEIREQRRKFLPVQRKWAKLIAKHQVYHHDEKAFLNIRQKLQNMRKYDKEYKLKVFEEMKAMLNCTKTDEIKLELKKEEIMLDYKMQLIQDRERQIRNEKKLLRLQQRNLEESVMELEYERELITAQKTKLHSQFNKERLSEISSLKQQLKDRNTLLTESNLKLQNALHKNDKLEIKLCHFEESMQKENDDKEKHKQSYDKFTKAMETLTKQFEQMVGTKDKEITKIAESMEEWKVKATELKRKNDQFILEKNELNGIIQELEEQNEELIARNEQLEYTVPQLTIDNEHLREQIQEMIISSDEAIKQHQQIGNKLNNNNNNNDSNMDLLAVDDETDNILSDATNYEETEAKLSSIRSQLANSDENGRLITKHESQDSMTAIVDLVKKTKENMESQSIDLAILSDQPSSDDNDDSLSDHLGLIEDMLNSPIISPINMRMKNRKNRKNNNNKIHLMHSDTDTMDDDIDNDNNNNDSNDSNDEPPMFWNDNDLENDENILQEMISNPNGVLEDVLSPTAHLNTNLIDHSALSDWDKSDDTKYVKKTKKRRKSVKKKRKKSTQSIDDLKNIKRNKKRSSKKLNKDELLIININENKDNKQNNDSKINDI